MKSSDIGLNQPIEVTETSRIFEAPITPTKWGLFVIATFTIQQDELTFVDPDGSEHPRTTKYQTKVRLS